MIFVGAVSNRCGFLSSQSVVVTGWNCADDDEDDSVVFVLHAVKAVPAARTATMAFA
ncbi:hypothetical protein GCM10027289_17720 [Tsukamurella serpentis]